MTSRILAFDTAAPHCAVVVLEGSAICAHRLEVMAKGQAERLMPLIEETLAEAGCTAAQLDAVAVGVGPGNFTGIRLAVAAARGLALSLNKPAIGVSSLQAMAEGGARPMLALLDARRGAVYAQLFDSQGTHPPERLEDLSALPKDIAWVGDVEGATPPALPRAEAIAQIAARRLASGEDLPRPAPLYLRPADAAPPRDTAPLLLP